MRKIAMLAAATLAATALTATSASAQVAYTDCGGGTCFPGQTDNVNIDTGAQGHIGSTLFFFSSSTDDLQAQGNGQATLVSPAPDALINQFTVTIQDGFAFTLAELQLQDQFSNDTMVTLTSSGGGSQSFPIDAEGSNRYGVDSALFGPITSVSLSSELGFGTIREIRIGDITQLQTPSVPEPATWAMMLMGFGATGVAMRRSRRRKGLLTQLA